jgi:hypothetical protein
MTTLTVFILTQVAVVANNHSMNKLPKVEGMMSYRSDDNKLYIKEKSQWKALANQRDVSFIMLKIHGLITRNMHRHIITKPMNQLFDNYS